MARFEFNHDGETAKMMRFRNYVEQARQRQAQIETVAEAAGAALLPEPEFIKERLGND